MGLADCFSNSRLPPEAAHSLTGIQDPGRDEPMFQRHSLACVHEMKPGAWSSRNGAFWGLEHLSQGRKTGAGVSGA